jgi:aspartate carbamoyltransferase catalytic subunit
LSAITGSRGNDLSTGVKISTNLDEALQWADVANMLRIQMERQDERYFPSIREYSSLYGLNMERMRNVNPELLIMHPGPINRGVEISSEVADSHNSIILQQVENGVAIRMAVLFLLAQKSL